MDDVVRTYHNGFNKALQNYSGILRHFSSAEEEVRGRRLEGAVGGGSVL